jgi:hypothetical protein
MAKGKDLGLIQSSDAAFNKFKKVFEQLSYSQNYADTFQDFLDFSLYMLSYVKSPEQEQAMARMEAKYKKKEQAHQMAELFMLFGQAAENYNDPGGSMEGRAPGLHDMLGDMFMELVSHGHNGQFFTPQHVSDMMAKMIIGDPGDKDDPFSGPKTMCDPACGSGRMILAAAKQDRNMIFYGADVSEMCVKMTALNMVVNTLVGEVACMNSLSLEHYWSIHIRKIKVGGMWLPIMFRTGKNQTRMLGSNVDIVTDYVFREDNSIVPYEAQKSEEHDTIVEMIRRLYQMMPVMDSREAIRAHADQSMYMAEKMELFMKHEAPRQERELPAFLQKADKKPEYVHQTWEDVARENIERTNHLYERAEKRAAEKKPVKKPAIVKSIKTKTKKPGDGLPKTGTLF